MAANVLLNECPYCSATTFCASYLPPTRFTGKIFHYKRCVSCRLIFLEEELNADDYKNLYSTEYHQKHYPDSRKKKSYQLHVDILKSIVKPGSAILDFGCGNGAFVKMVKENFPDAKVYGVEFNPEHVAHLRETIQGVEFCTTDDFFASFPAVDILYMGDVLEHLTRQNVMFPKILQRIRPSGYYFAEGPLEDNFNVGWLVRKLFFSARLRKNPSFTAQHNPTHTIFANRKNQLQCFETNGLRPVKYFIREDAWPFPLSLKGLKGMSKLFQYGIAHITKITSFLIPSWGNRFVFLGQYKPEAVLAKHD
jgi:SAM-dependent methyltransferase